MVGEIEIQVQLEFLKKRKCEVIQGFYFGTPMKNRDLEKFGQNLNKIPKSSFFILKNNYCFR